MTNLTPSSPPIRQAFSPVFVRESPVKRIAQSGNLTGEPRRARDLAAELHALVQRWGALHLEGLQLLTAMAPSIQLCREECCEIPTLQDQCDQLDKIHKSLCTVVESMDVVAKQYHSLESLTKDKDVPMFLTWPASKFSEVSGKLCQAYRTELAAKKRVIENVVHSTDRATMTYYMALWMHQVYVESDVELGLESLLLETGHRNAC